MNHTFHFLLKYIKEEITPNALKYTIESSIGNHNEELLTRWYKIKRDCWIKTTKLTRDFCDKTFHKMNLATTNPEQTLKKNTSNKKFVKLKNEIYAQKRHSKNRLQQQQEELVEKNPKNGKNRLISHLEQSNQQKVFQQIPKHMSTWYETMESANLFLFSEKKIQDKKPTNDQKQTHPKKIKRCILSCGGRQEQNNCQFG